MPMPKSTLTPERKKAQNAKKQRDWRAAYLRAANTGMIVPFGERSPKLDADAMLEELL